MTCLFFVVTFPFFTVDSYTVWNNWWLIYLWIINTTNKCCTHMHTQNDDTFGKYYVCAVRWKVTASTDCESREQKKSHDCGAKMWITLSKWRKRGHLHWDINTLNVARFQTDAVWRQCIAFICSRDSRTHTTLSTLCHYTRNTVINFSAFGPP